MTGREVIKENDAVLRGIVRSIDKNLDYSTVEGAPACFDVASVLGMEKVWCY